MRMGARCVTLLAAAALTLGMAPAAAAALPFDQKHVAVTVPDEAAAHAVQQDYDVVEAHWRTGDGIEIQVIADDEELAQLRAKGYKIGRTIADANTWLERIEEREQTIEQETIAGELARKGMPRGGMKFQGRSIIPTPGETVIQRANKFTNYAGTFLYVEAHNKNTVAVPQNQGGTQGPVQAMSWAGADGVYSEPVNMVAFVDRDPSPDEYMYHRSFIHLPDAYKDVDAKTMTVRVASASGATDTFQVTEWLGSSLPAHAEGYLTDFHTKYMDPSEVYAQLDQLTSEFPSLVTRTDLPHMTNGYQRKAMAMVGLKTPYPGNVGNLGGYPSNNNPNPDETQTIRRSQALILNTHAWGHEGGNQVSIEIRDPGAPNSPLSVAVTGSDIVVNLATDETGALSTTTAQLVAALNADAAASALVLAQTYRGNDGDGITQPGSKTMLSDFLNAPARVPRGPFQPRVYRIGATRDGSKTGVFLYCQQHAREWATPLTCLETAERLVRNYALDPQTKTLLDNLEVFILPVVNPDGGHYSFHDFGFQRRNLTNRCAADTFQDPMARNAWGVDLNRNSGEYSLFDGYSGASTNCTSDVFAGPAEYSEPEIMNEKWVADAFPNIKFANNIHSHGGYFMWAPGSYIGQGRVTAPAPNIGIERYFFEAGEKILTRIKEERNTVILPERTGPIADVLYSAAGNSADDQWYRKGIISYSFETGAERIEIEEDGDIDRDSVGFQPDYDEEGRYEAFEFANGNFGLLESAYDYATDTTPPVVDIEYDTTRTTGAPINYRFNWVNEASVIHYTTDGSTPTLSSPTYNSQRARGAPEVLCLCRLGVHDVKWIAVDIKGNVSEVRSQRFLIGPESEVGGTVPATLSLTLGAPASFGAFTPGVTRDYNASTTANVISTAADAALSVTDPSANHTGHLVNGSFFLPQKLQANANGGAFGAVGGTSDPTTVLSYAGPVSNDAVTLGFRQSIDDSDALRTGSYSKTLTFTLSTTNP
jgi:hypothetical protein